MYTVPEGSLGKIGFRGSKKMIRFCKKVGSNLTKNWSVFQELSKSEKSALM